MRRDFLRSFWRGVLDGLASPVTLFSGSFKPRRYGDVGDAWRNAGDYLRGAASAMDPLPRSEKTFETDDAKALQGDMDRVGEDFRRAMKEHSRGRK